MRKFRIKRYFHPQPTTMRGEGALFPSFLRLSFTFFFFLSPSSCSWEIKLKKKKRKRKFGLTITFHNPSSSPSTLLPLICYSLSSCNLIVTFSLSLCMLFIELSDGFVVMLIWRKVKQHLSFWFCPKRKIWVVVFQPPRSVGQTAIPLPPPAPVPGTTTTKTNNARARQKHPLQQPPQAPQLRLKSNKLKKLTGIIISNNSRIRILSRLSPETKRAPGVNAG